MSGRGKASVGQSVYLGAAEANALVGAWRDGRWGQPYTFNVSQSRQSVPVTVTPSYNQGYGYNQGYNQGYGYQPHQAWGGQTQQAQYGRNAYGERWHGYEWRRRHEAGLRERRKREWERRYPGVPFVGVEALMPLMGASSPLFGADLPLMGADPDGGPPPDAAPPPDDGGLSGLAPRAYLREMPPPNMANRQVLPMNTGTTSVPIASTAQITSRPQRVAFRPERVFVSSADIGGSGSAANWIINDITIGNRSQFAQSGALPGDMFSNVAIDSFVTFETAQTAMDVVMIVTYQGSTEGGTPFYGSIIGTAAV